MKGIKNWVNVMYDIQTEENVETLADVGWCALALMGRMGYDSEKVMEKLRESNMSKTFKTYEAAEAELPEGGSVVEAGDYFVIMNSWNKIMKPKTFINMSKKEVDECKYQP